MPRQATRLNMHFVRKVTLPGKYYDENGLIMLVKDTGAKSWVQRLTIQGRRRDIGLGPYPLVTLGEARQVAYDNRKLARVGGDPRELRAKRHVPTFREAAATVIEVHSPNWRNAKSVTAWESTLRSYAYPKIGDVPVDAIKPADVLRCLLPIWNMKRETARKTRQRIGTVMKWAIAEGHRKDNPAGEVIGAALPKVGHKTTHQRAMAHGEVDAALRKVRNCNALASTKLAFEFLVLTACRSREVREAKWGEVDLDARVWTVPGDRTKTGNEHRVPLSRRAISVLREARGFRESDLVFPTATGRTMSDNTLSKLLRDLGIAAVPHGFRSTFGDWCGEMANAPREVAEEALGHKVGNVVDQAYARSDLFDKRRALMESWARYVTREAGEVIELPRMA